MTEPTTPAGWYDDGSGTGALRYWDGSAWTDHRAPAPTAPAAGPADTTTPIGDETPVASHDTLPYGSPAA
ncbi:MAG: DUF2510 domain-containing protein, partial [Actinomycetota bacterium]|nr:DUF2510 domain-containing protein [Actinomycetota bacterium]